MAEENFDLQVSEPIPCEVDYHLSQQELTEYFDLQYQQLQEGRRQSATMELAMLGYAMDFVSFAESATKSSWIFKRRVWEHLRQFWKLFIRCLLMRSLLTKISWIW